MYPISPAEHLIENRICKKCSTLFPITDKDMEFYSKVSPSFGSPHDKGGRGIKKYLIPPPTLCPDCRQQRRLAFRNERKLYKRKCDATGKNIVSIYSPDKPYTVYHQDYWWSDAWDPMSYAREFDFGRSAIEQFGELMGEVPRFSLANVYTTLENSEYCNHFASSKDCYMSFNGSDNERCLYSDWFGNTKDSVDISITMNSENIYECCHVENLYGCTFVESSQNCQDSYFLFESSGCSDCILCTNLINRKYCIRNVQLSQEDFLETKRNMLSSNSIRDLLGEFLELKKNTVRKSRQNRRTERCFGDRLVDSVDTYGFDGRNIEHSKYIYSIWNTKQSMDCYELASSCEGVLECMSSDSIQFALMSLNSVGSTRISYCDMCMFCSDCLLCIGLRNKQYCILNRQYTKEEYQELVPHIIEKMIADSEWGEFFPASMSPFGYNETVANEYFPLSRDEVFENGEKSGSSPLTKGDVTEGQGNLVNENGEERNPPNPLSQGGIKTETFLYGPTFNWSDYESPFPKVEKIIPANKLPESIEGIPDDILNWAIECEVSGKPFRIIRQELEFYRKHSLPIPRRHPDVRHMDRMRMRNPRKLFERLCDSENCEENWRKKGVILKEREDAEYYCIHGHPESDSGSSIRNRQDAETSSAGQGMGKLRKKMITTYAPERTETVYCEVCYEKGVVG